MEASSNDAIEKLAEAMARRAAVVRMTPKSAVLESQMAGSDFLRRIGERHGQSSEKQANKYMDAIKGFAGGVGSKLKGSAQESAQESAGGMKGWWGGVSDANKGALRNAGIGALGAGLGGAALNYMNTDEDDERRNPLGAGLTGAIGGAALGGLGTLGFNAAQGAMKESPDTTEKRELDALKRKADKTIVDHVSGSLGAAVATPEGVDTSVADQWRSDLTSRIKKHTSNLSDKVPLLNRVLPDSLQNNEGLDIRPETISNIAAGVLPTSILANDLRVNRNIGQGREGGFWTKARTLGGGKNFDMPKAVERALKDKTIAGTLPKGLAERLNDPKFQEQLRNAYKNKTELSFHPWDATKKRLQPHSVQKLHRVLTQQGNLAVPRKLRGLRSMSLRAGIPGLIAGFSPEIADAYGGTVLNKLDSDHAARHYEAQQRYR